MSNHSKIYDFYLTDVDWDIFSYFENEHVCPHNNLSNLVKAYFEYHDFNIHYSVKSVMLHDAFTFHGNELANQKVETRPMVMFGKLYNHEFV